MENKERMKCLKIIFRKNKINPVNQDMKKILHLNSNFIHKIYHIYTFLKSVIMISRANIIEEGSAKSHSHNHEIRI